MKDLIVTIKASTRKVRLNKDFIGLRNENLQGNIIVDFEDEFVDGVGCLEVVINNEKFSIPLDRNITNKIYLTPIKANLLKWVGTITCQVKITQAKVNGEVPIFRSEQFALPCKEAICAESELPDDPQSWQEEMESIIADIQQQSEETIEAIKGSVLNPNLLINGDFRVNQRGQTIYSRTSGRVYTADRWGIWSNNCTFDVETKTLTNLVTSGNAIMSQFIEDSEALFGKTITLSANINNTIYTATGTVANSYDNATSDTPIFVKEISNMYYIRVTWDNSRKKIRVDIGCTPTGNNITIKYVKLEIGSVATAFSPRPYAEELAMCQRYYQKLRVHDTQYCSNVNAMYPNINLIQTLRKVPTINVVTYPSIRGNGANLGIVDNLTADLVRDNILMCTTNASSLGVVAGQIYAITNGEITADAEF